jgi:hypothetical protein
MAIVRTVLPRKGLIQPQHGLTGYENDQDANWAQLDANVVFTSDLTAEAYQPTAGSGLTLNISSGVGFVNGAVATYSGGSLTLTASATNYVYLDPTAGLQPAFNTSGFQVGQIPVAEVTTSSTAITAITDCRTEFISTFGAISAGQVIAGPASGSAALATARALAYSDLPGSPVSANQVLAGPASGSAAAPAWRALKLVDLPGSMLAQDLGIDGVASGFTLSTSGSLTPGLTAGVLYAQGIRYAPASAPTIPAATASATSYLFYNSSTGFYWQSTAVAATAGDALIGQAVTSSSAVTAVTQATKIMGQIAVSPGASGNFTVQHFLGHKPVGAVIMLTSTTLIVFQSTMFDTTNLYLNAAGASTGTVLVW